MDETKNKHYPNALQSWGIVGIIILSMLMLIPLHVFLDGTVSDELSLFIYYSLSMGIPFLIAHSLRKKITQEGGYDLSLGSFKVIMVLSITIIALQIGIVSPLVNAIPMPDFVEDLFRSLADKTGFFAFITIVVAAPFLEELIFRGIILNGLLKKYTPLKAIVLSSFLFGIVHLNPWQFVSALCIGIFSGWVYYKTRKLSLSILIHLGNNLVAFLSTYFVEAETMLDQSFLEMYGGFINFLIITLTGIIIAAAGILLLRKEFNQTNIGNWKEMTQ